VNSIQQSPREGSIAPSLLDYLQVLRRHKLVFLLIVFIVSGTAVALSIRQPPVYQASARVLLASQNSSNGASPYVDPARVAETQAELARVPPVLRLAIAAVPEAHLSQETLLEKSTVATTLGSDLLTFSVKNTSPELAMRLANAYATAFTQYRHRLDVRDVQTNLDRVRRQLTQLRATGATGSEDYRNLVTEERQLAAQAAIQTPSLQVVDRAHQAPKVGPRTKRNGLIAFCLGIMLALIVVFLMDALDTRVRSADTIRDALGLPLLGRLPAPPARLVKGGGIVMLNEPASFEAEAFKVLRASFDFANGEHGSRTVMFTSAGNTEGKSTTAANLAVALARAGRHVILVDADLRRPTLHTIFGLDERPGLTDVELGDAQLENALRVIPFTDAASGADAVNGASRRSGRLQVLPAGHALHDPDELGAERASGRIIQRARELADIVLVDAAPLLVGDAIALSAHVDALVLITRLSATRRSTLDEVGRILDASPAIKLGFVLTGAEKGEGYATFRTYAPANRRSADVVRLTTPPASANGDQEAAERLRREQSARDT
jgi:capsular exopolysaccharide synthesis family protein